MGIMRVPPKCTFAIDLQRGLKQWMYVLAKYVLEGHALETVYGVA